MKSSRAAIIAIACVLGNLLTSLAYPYEVDTHVEMSLNAARQSSLSTFLPIIGLGNLRDSLTDIQTTHSIEDWIALGANDEDDTFSSNFARYRNHFYDPQHGGAGYSYGIFSGEPSPNWALEDVQTFATQSYSFNDARKYFYDALTLPDKDNREMWMARTFYTLGHVVHHIQDMAQPQHTRNDSHGGFFLGPRSRYELYTDSIRAGLPFSDSNYNQNNPVAFSTARSFWDTGDGRGMAEFSSRNFVSFGTNFDTSLYPLPRFLDAVPHDENANDLLQSIGVNPPPECSAPNPSCVMTFYTTQVVDRYRPIASSTNTRTSTESIFDQDLKVGGATPAFSLNRFNFDAAQLFLIPRGVAYSAGLLDHFFRGKIDFVAEPIPPNYRIQNLGSEPISGEFELYADIESSGFYRYKVNSWKTSDLIAGGSLAPGTDIEVNPNFYCGILPSNSILVFKGQIGNEGPSVTNPIGAIAARIPSLGRPEQLNQSQLAFVTPGTIQSQPNPPELYVPSDSNVPCPGQVITAPLLQVFHMPDTAMANIGTIGPSAQTLWEKSLASLPRGQFFSYGSNVPSPEPVILEEGKVSIHMDINRTIWIQTGFLGTESACFEKIDTLVATITKEDFQQVDACGLKWPVRHIGPFDPSLGPHSLKVDY